MGEEVDRLLTKSIEALENNDMELAKKISKLDTNINKLEREIQEKCMKIILLQKPFASDLRILTGYSKIVTDIERIADQCVDICEIISMKKIVESPECVVKVVPILKKVSVMFKRTLRSCIEFNSDEARLICKSDDEIDAMFSDIILNVSNVISKNPTKIQAGADLMFITKYAERIGDHCTNIAEWIIYVSTGFHFNLN
ncbi:MAG: phosphate signaling complex protein PhoU [Firmicutes bacterium]|nr:phosphate signaling complex protein PhoU [Bacillota bacterium]